MIKPMRICFVNPTVLLRRPIVDLAILLSKEGHEITVVTPNKARADEMRESDQRLQESDKIKVVYIESYEIRSMLWSFPVKLSFMRLLRKTFNDQDIIHVWAPYYILSLVPLWLKWRKKLSVPVVLTFDTFPAQSFQLSPVWLNFFMKLYVHFVTFLFNSVDSITLYSKLLLPYAREIGLDQHKIAILPTGVHIKTRTEDSLSFRQKYNIDTDTTIVVFVGLLNARKGVDTLLKIARVLRDQSKILFVLVGDGPLREKCEQSLRMNLLNHRVLLLGAQTNMAPIYAASDALILPSRGEGLPGVIMEAMSWKLPIIASDIPCIPDLVHHERNGYLCEMDDYKNFAKYIKTLSSVPDLRNDMSQESWNLIQSFDWKTILPRYEQLYIRHVQ